ncbi:MAG: hypothetical protein FJ312_08865 [SAR202 cluster bacterium]|nr:hypothetical protein [SAR202 cluster bacterium]
MNQLEPGCTKVRELCSDYVDGELDIQASRHVASHLGECGPCQALIATLKATIALLRIPQHHRAPDSLRARVKQNIKGIKA